MANGKSGMARVWYATGALPDAIGARRRDEAAQRPARATVARRPQVAAQPRSAATRRGLGRPDRLISAPWG